MLIEILCTGDEILTGKTINTNYSHMARRFGEVGLTMHWSTVVGDDRSNLMSAFEQASKRADVVIVNGGLGPTVDDLSQEIAAEAAGVELVLDTAWLSRMIGFYERRGRTMPPNNKKQAMLPAGAEFIDNPIGTACGFAINIGKARFFFTPGVPREMRRMIDEQIIPRLLKMSGLKVVNRLKRFHSFGVGESRADQMLDDIEALSEDGSLKLGFQAHYPQLETKLAVQAKTDAELDLKLAPAINIIRERLGNFIFAEDDQTLEGVVIESLLAQKATLATAEMFTSGAMAARLNPKPGTNDPILRNIVARDLNQLKNIVGMDSDTKTAVTSLDAAKNISDFLKKQSGASYALSVLITLDHGSDKIELGGNIDIGISGPKETTGRHARMLGGYDWIRLGATELALDTLRRHLNNLPIDEQIDFEKR
jgi:nicotinamide-nucleotide amidase